MSWLNPDLDASLACPSEGLSAHRLLSPILLWGASAIVLLAAVPGLWKPVVAVVLFLALAVSWTRTALRFGGRLVRAERGPAGCGCTACMRALEQAELLHRLQRMADSTPSVAAALRPALGDPSVVLRRVTERAVPPWARLWAWRHAGRGFLVGIGDARPDTTSSSPVVRWASTALEVVTPALDGRRLSARDTAALVRLAQLTGRRVVVTAWDPLRAELYQHWATGVAGDVALRCAVAIDPDADELSAAPTPEASSAAASGRRHKPVLFDG